MFFTSTPKKKWTSLFRSKRSKTNKEYCKLTSPMKNLKIDSDNTKDSRKPMKRFETSFGCCDWKEMEDDKFTVATDPPSSRSLQSSGSSFFEYNQKKEDQKSPMRFKSVLDRPFRFWKQLDAVLESCHPEWSLYQRGRLIHHIIHFLELKVVIDRDDIAEENLLLPSPLVDQAWKAVVLETRLYRQVTRHIQDYHNKPRSMIPYSLLAMRKGNLHERLERTQYFFQAYFRETMPMAMDEEMETSSERNKGTMILYSTQPILDRSSRSDEISISNSSTDVASTASSHALQGLTVLSFSESLL